MSAALRLCVQRNLFPPSTPGGKNNLWEGGSRVIAMARGPGVGNDDLVPPNKVGRITPAEVAANRSARATLTSPNGVPFVGTYEKMYVTDWLFTLFGMVTGGDSPVGLVLPQEQPFAPLTAGLDLTVRGSH